MIEEIDEPPMEKLEPRSASLVECNYVVLNELHTKYWDLFFKAFAVYLIACSVLVGYGLAEGADLFRQLFAGIAVVVASLVFKSFVPFMVDLLKDIHSKLIAMSAHGLVPISMQPMFNALDRIGVTLNVFIATGVLYIAHVVLMQLGGRSYLLDLFGVGPK